jgi:rRNA maturation endonuclease Nob1
MTNREQVHPSYLGANGLWNIFTGRKKYTIVCGVCKHTFKDRVPFATDRASALCPCCGAQNTWSHNSFARDYDEKVRQAEQRKFG